MTILRPELTPLDRIIWSADVEDEAALQAVLATMPDLRCLKIDRAFLEGGSLEIIAKLQYMGLKVFDDSKMVEIPTKLLAIAKKHLAYRPWMLNCMAGSASTMLMQNPNPDKIDGLKRFADACHEAGTRPCAVTVLTTKVPSLVAQEFNGRTPVDQVLTYVGMLLECGFTDVVCSAEEAPAIRAESRFDGLCLVTPGIRLPEGDANDQARVVTPEAAVEGGSDYLVIGRPLTNGVPADNLRTIANRLPQAA